MKLLSVAFVVVVATALPAALFWDMDLSNPQGLTDFAAIAPVIGESGRTGKTSTLPTVFMHGMGDSCFNPGMQSITAAVGKHVGTYSVCVPTGPDQGSDTNNGFFMTMNDNVDVFAKAIMNNTALAGGFNAVGFSQGNSVIRGYIQKYNNPPVSTFLSVHGTVVGVAAFPHCNPVGLLGPVCRILSKFVVGPGAYTELMQKRLFQADYFREADALSHESYKKNSQLAQWNNEGETVDPKINANFAKVKRWAMVKAMKDTMVYPNDGEWWGQFAADGKTRLAMNETEWYTKDLFGLKTADQAGKIMFDSSPGNHLQFTETELFGWVDKYFLE